ncbi:hypothetical protein NDU88_003440 [Pleurodeles waltl]|uniref:Uncharacterized protein n=1 Tax=Pleurodeles waltl TaxID=8319 RepID=A0AAV7VHG0_PLEWA|nr:hypothetical protein NDU88_003440 [Pleurodeles waltl]
MNAASVVKRTFTERFCRRAWQDDGRGTLRGEPHGQAVLASIQNSGSRSKGQALPYQRQRCAEAQRSSCGGRQCPRSCQVAGVSSGAGLAVKTATSGTSAAAKEERGPPVPQLWWGAKHHVAWQRPRGRQQAQVGGN